jgi:hypothetical protein
MFFILYQAPDHWIQVNHFDPVSIFICFIYIIINLPPTGCSKFKPLLRTCVFPFEKTHVQLSLSTWERIARIS